MKESHIVRTTPRSAFTLAETLAVVAATVIVLSFAVPAARAVREQSAEQHCRQKLATIARASMAYAQRDPNELIIPIGPGESLDGPAGTTTEPCPYTFGGKSGRGHAEIITGSPWGPAALMSATNRPLNGVIYKAPFAVLPVRPGPNGINWLQDTLHDLDVYHCPSDVSFPGMHHLGWNGTALSSYNYYGTSYAAATLFFNVNQTPNPVRSNSVYRRPLSGVPVPAESIVYWENAARFAWTAYLPEIPEQQGSCACRDCFGPPYVAHGWHNQDWHFNMVFADGHSDWVNIQGFLLTEIEDPPAECAPSNCQCQLVRGPGWRLDTIPAPFIPVPFIGPSSETIYNVVP